MFDQLDRLDQLTEPLRGMLDSPWLWLIILLVSALDALLPFMPSETTVVLVAVLIGPDPAPLALLAGVAAAGALAGDCLGYAVGRRAGPRALARLLRGARGRTRHAGARAMVERHAALLVVAGRFVSAAGWSPRCPPAVWAFRCAASSSWTRSARACGRCAARRSAASAGRR